MEPYDGNHIDNVVQENYFTFPILVNLYKFPSKTIEKSGEDYLIIGRLTDDFDRFLLSEKQYTLVQYLTLAESCGLIKEGKIMSDIDLLARCLKIGDAQFSKNDDYVFAEILKLICDFGIPNPKIIANNLRKNLGVYYSEIVNCAKSAYLNYSSWLATVHHIYDNLKKIDPSSDYFDISLRGKIYFTRIPSDEVNLKLTNEQQPTLIFECKNGWLDIINIQLKYLMTGNTSKIKVCLDCKFPFTIKSRNQRYCDNCSSDAARQRRSRKRKEEKKDVNKTT